MNTKTIKENLFRRIDDLSSTNRDSFTEMVDNDPKIKMLLGKVPEPDKDL